jgi:hypothetical protein
VISSPVPFYVMQGLAGEYLVMADLLKQCVPCYPAAQGCRYDVVADTGSKLIRIQVKAAAQARLSSRNRFVYRYSLASREYDKSEFDLFAFVALDRGYIAYTSSSVVSQGWIQFNPPGLPKKSPQKLNDMDSFPFTKALEEIA